MTFVCVCVCDPTAGSDPGTVPTAWSSEQGGTWEGRRLRWTDQSDCCSGETLSPWDSAGGGWRVEWKVEGRVGWREGQEVEECFTSTLSNDRKHLDTSTRLNPSPPRPSLWTNHFQSRRSATTPIDHWQTCVKCSQSEAPTCQSFAPNECECFCCDSVVTDSTWVCGWEVVKVITVKSSTDALSGYRDPPYTWL